MELDHLRCLIAVAEFANLVRAAEHLHLSPPAVFGQIRKLEEETSEKLYQRSGKSLALTHAGRVLLEHARRILKEHDQALVAVRESREIGRGSIRFGCGPDTSICIAPHLMRVLLAAYPNVEITNITGDRRSLLHELREGQIDAMLATPIEVDSDFEIVPLWQHESVFIVSPQDPLARRKKVMADEISGKRFILPGDGRSRQTEIRRFFSMVGFEPKIVMNHNYAGGIKEVVKLGLGVSLLPYWSIAEEVRLGHLSALRLKGLYMTETTGLVYRKSERVSGVLSALITAAREWRKWLPVAGDLLPITE